MGAVTSGVLAKIRSLVPNQEIRWTDAFLQSVISLANNAVRERLEDVDGEYNINLVADKHVYALPNTGWISVDEVEATIDGTNYEYTVTPATFSDLDEIHRRWRDTRGSHPIHYVLISAPGINYRFGSSGPPSQILIYPPPSSVTNEKIRVHGKTASEVSTSDLIQTKAHVPYCLSLLYAHEHPDMAMEYYQEFLDGCDDLRSQFLSRGSEAIQRGIY